MLFPARVEEAQKQARELLLARSVRVGGPFQLASGRTSDFYVDVKQTSLYPQGAAALGRLLAAALKDMDVAAIGGPTLGADPLATAGSLALLAQGRHIPAYIVRKEPKGHGTNVWVEGLDEVPKGSAVALIEDVVTSGGSGLKAARRIEEAGYRIAVFLCIVDREEGGAEAVAKAGYRFVSLFRRSELMG